MRYAQHLLRHAQVTIRMEINQLFCVQKETYATR